MLVVGAKGFAKELLQVIYANDTRAELVFFDDISKDLDELLFNKYAVITDKKEVKKYLTEIDNRYVLGLGNPALRYKLAHEFNLLGGELTTIISQRAIIGHFNNNIEKGVNILNNVVIEADNAIGEGCLIHNAAFISHDVTVGKFCEISPGVNLLGGVSVGNFCSVGTNAVILPKVKIGNNVVIGAAALVNKDVPDNCVVAGVPAKLIKNLIPFTL
jgi:sugar O-acyltransferase (sialic acid O-acetyltransferase NeuD family)